MDRIRVSYICLMSLFSLIINQKILLKFSVFTGFIGPEVLGLVLSLYVFIRYTNQVSRELHISCPDFARLFLINSFQRYQSA